MNEIYAIDSTRVSHREYWWGTKSPLVVIGWITKWLRIRIPSSTDDPNFESTLPWAVDSLPPEVMERFGPLAGELSALGFYDVAYHCFRDPGTQTTIYWATFLHESGTHFARLHQRIWGQSQKVSRALFPMFLTGFTDGTFFVSSAGKPDTATPPTVPMNRMPGASTATLWAAHQEKAAAYGAQRLPARVSTEQEAIDASERHHLLLRDFNLARGVFRPRTNDEQTKADSFAASVAQAQAGGMQNPEVLAELDRLQEHKPGWGNTIWILLISIVAFAIAGAKLWDWKFTLWLIPVLLLHETGHWVAMRLFRYRNLKMFFIPFFGAAVIGRHWNVPGWKKGIVSLAGPLPGIALGSVLAVVALIVKTPWLNELAFMLLILNGFNLLPVLPLDGGHLLHVTLFCRNRWLDIAFRCAAAGGLIVLGLLGVGRFLMFIGIALGLGLPVAFKQAKVVDRMRRVPLPPPLPEQDRIPAETAQAIIAALKEEQPKGLSNKMLAQQTLAVCETLNAKPPGVLATLGLLTVHGGALFVSLLFCGLLVMGKFGGGLGNMFSAAARQPQHEVKCTQPVQTWRGKEAGHDPTRNLLVSTLDRHAEAAEVYSNLTTRLPATASLTLFGDSLLLSLPADDDAARERWFNSLQMHSADTFVVVSNRPVAMSLFLLAPTETEATDLAQELQACSAVAGLQLIPPWSAMAKSPAYTNYLHARLAWLRLNETGVGYWTNATVRDLNQRIADATKRGDTIATEQLSTERETLLKDLQRKEREVIRAELAGTPAAALVDLHEQLGATSYTNRTERAALLHQVGVLLGQAPDNGGHSTAATRAEGGYIGTATSTGLIVEVPWCSFNDPQTSLPLLFDWLCAKDCGKVKYNFSEYNFLSVLSDLNEEPDEPAPTESPAGN